ncbi:hypothetical protein [Candidatus Laterigemmans baculatus]|uniref:hypothetical protein n=1 Tax=Candidatus Laterigemmans baculatus TaxID=2770505 RepID=UPI0013DD2085|nr:hypothetical protein [Candidatus Laterigemmans baculatus]
MVYRPRLRLMVKAMIRQFADPPSVKGLEGWIVSPGGVATTALLQHLSRFLTVNAVSDSDGLKHWPRPPQDWSALGGTRILFVSGDADVIYRSIRRRGWVEAQAAKLGCLTGVIARGDRQRRAFIAAVEAQKANWRAASSESLRFITYDTLWDSAEHLAAYFGIDDRRFVSEFPKQRARLSVANSALLPQRYAA